MQYSAWASSQPKYINPSRNCYHPIYKNAISNFWAGLHRGAPGPQLVKIFFCVSFVDCVGHFHMCCVSSNCPHLGHEVVSCSFHLTINLLTPHMPAVCFEMKTCLDKGAEVFAFWMASKNMWEIWDRGILFFSDPIFFAAGECFLPLICHDEIVERYLCHQSTERSHWVVLWKVSKVSHCLFCQWAHFYI